LFRLPEETRTVLLQALKPTSAYDDEHGLHLNIIRIALQEALKLESKAIAELMELLFENWQPENSLELDKLNFRLHYNEILAITESHLLPVQITALKQILVEQIKQDEEFAKKLQAELWRDGESKVSTLFTEQCQAGTSNKHVNISSAAFAAPLVFLQTSNANSSH
jgi:hypothetical protein